jgi:hypothetical protein
MVLERSGKAGRQCDIVRELAGDFVVYERFFAEHSNQPPPSVPIGDCVWSRYVVLVYSMPLPLRGGGG